jgi:hypothetical protein
VFHPLIELQVVPEADKPKAPRKKRTRKVDDSDFDEPKPKRKTRKQKEEEDAVLKKGDKLPWEAESGDELKKPKKRTKKAKVSKGQSSLSRPWPSPIPFANDLYLRPLRKTL